ncbi:MAG: hypothetical protein OXI20_20880 [Rhodospirillales bacterium]|nr:hypothetical protein [Rhodospirillales bacterium]
MILTGEKIRVWLATRPVDFRKVFCRFEIEAWIEGYILRKTTILSFPEDFAMAKLTRLLREPLMQGYPPALSWYESLDGPGTYSVELNTGQGSDWGLRGQAGVREHVRKTVEDHLEVIAAMDRLAQDWDDGAAFDELNRLAARANIACRCGTPGVTIARGLRYEIPGRIERLMMRRLAFQLVLFN